MSGENIYNPYDQFKTVDFNNNNNIPYKLSSQYINEKGNPFESKFFPIQYSTSMRLPNKTIKKENFTSVFPKELINIKRSQYSSSTNALIETDRVGVQLGMPDVYKDNLYKDFTTGIQYYTIYTGTNPKTLINPLIYPQAYRNIQNVNNFDQINNSNITDITELSMDYSCKNCIIPSATLGTPVPYKPRNPNAPLPVSAYPGEWPNIGQYTARQLDYNTRDFPQPIQAINEIQKRQSGFSPTFIPEEYDYKMFNQRYNESYL